MFAGFYYIPTAITGARVQLRALPLSSDNERDVLGADATRKYGCVQIASNHEFHRE